MLNQKLLPSVIIKNGLAAKSGLNLAYKKTYTHIFILILIRLILFALLSKLTVETHKYSFVAFLSIFSFERFT